MEQDGKCHWFLAVGSKLCSTPFDDKNNEDFRSTKPSKFHTKSNGLENKQHSELRNHWKMTLKVQKDLFGQCICVHVCGRGVHAGASRRAQSGERGFSTK